MLYTKSRSPLAYNKGVIPYPPDVDILMIYKEYSYAKNT